MSLSARRLFSSAPARRAATSLADFGKRHVVKGVGRSSDYVLLKGEGSWVTTAPKDQTFEAQGTGEGRRMLDFTSGIGVANLGHCHPKVTQAAQKQCGEIVHAQVNIGFSKPYLQLVNALLPVMPHESLDTFFFWNSGAEAVEAAVKLARMATGRQNIICMQGSYHGRTMGTMAMTKSKTVYSAGFLPAMPGTFSTPFPYWHQLGVPKETSPEEMADACLYQLELLLAQQTAPRDTAAIILEPVLGEGGYVPGNRRFLEGLQRICNREGIMLIIDEVQSGFGRCGKYFAVETIAPGLKPDILVMAKGIANGYPLSGIVTRKELADKQPPGSMGGTYAGNAVSCAAGVACAEVMKNDKILENVAARSEQLLAGLQELQSSPKTGHLFADVRGLGLMIGVEFATPAPAFGQRLPGGANQSDNPAIIAASGDVGSGKAVASKAASRVAAKCIEKGMFILTTSVYETIRFIPPLTVSEEEMQKGIDIFSEAVHEVAEEG